MYAHTHAQMDKQPENIIPPNPCTGEAEAKKNNRHLSDHIKIAFA